MSSTFPLFNLPFIPLSRVLNTINLYELIQFSLCSKITHKVIKSLRHKSIKYNVEILFRISGAKITCVKSENSANSEYSTIHISKLSQLPDDKNYEIIKIGDSLIPFIKEEKKNLNEEERKYWDEIFLQTYFEDIFIGTKTITDYVTEFFNCQVDDLIISVDPVGPRKIVDWLMSRQNSIQYYFMEDDTLINDEELAHILKNCKLTDGLNLDVKPSDQFQCSFSFQIKEFTIKRGYWITLDNLLSINCCYINLKKTQLTNNQMNIFLKHWTNGNNFKIKYMYVEMEILNVQELFFGLEVTEMPDEVERKYKTIDNIEVSYNGGFDIRRNDGVTATITHHREYIGNTRFQMIVSEEEEEIVNNFEHN